LGTYRLICHPDTPPIAVRNINVTLVEDPEGLLLRWRVDGCAELVLPAYAGSGRADELWQSTCFELFAQGRDAGYDEFNFSPSQRWSAYRFSTYREGMADRDMPEGVQIEHQQGDRFFVLTVKLPRLRLDAERIGLSAVIEERGGTRSYWALVHPAGKPDFHDAACFIAGLPAPGIA